MKSKATGWSCSYWTLGRYSCTFRYWDDCSGFCPSWLNVLVLGSLGSRQIYRLVLIKNPWTLRNCTLVTFHHFQTQLKIGKCRLHSDCLLPGGEEQKWKDLSAKSSSASDSLQRRHVCSAAELPLSCLRVFILVRSLLLAAPFWCQDWKHCSAWAQLQVCEVAAGRIHFCSVYPRTVDFIEEKSAQGLPNLLKWDRHVRKLAVGKTGGKELRGLSVLQSAAVCPGRCLPVN